MKPNNRNGSQYKAPKVALTGILNEFRTALEDEIEAARQMESSSAVPLVNGRRIHQLGKAYQYFFEIENALNVPGDAPGELNIKGRNPIPVTIISVDGLSITLSVEEDLGETVPHARLQSNMAMLMRKLIERIEGYQNKPNKVGSRVLGESPVSGDLADISNAKGLNQYQSDAVRSSIGYDATFIWGPPGTGKTETIGSIGGELYMRGRSLLVVSHTNTAVDQAILRIARKVPEDDIKAGRVIRVGEPKDKELLGKTELHLRTHVERKAAELAARKKEAERKLLEAIQESDRLARLLGIAEWLEIAQADIVEMERALHELMLKESALQVKQAELSALSQKSEKWAEAKAAAQNGKVVQQKIKNFGTAFKQARSEAEELLSKLNETTASFDHENQVLSETSSVSWLTRKWRKLPPPEQQQLLVNKLQKEADDLKEQHKDRSDAAAYLEQQIVGFTNELNAFKSRYRVDPDVVLRKAAEYDDKCKSLAADIRAQASQCSYARNQLGSEIGERYQAVYEWGLTQENVQRLEDRIAATRSAFENAFHTYPDLKKEQVKKDIEAISSLMGTLRAEIRLIEEALKKVEEVVIAEATVVATTLTRAYLRDSIQNRRFDTVLLDEASMAPIPALWIAAGIADNNVIVVGDPKQLPPIVMATTDLAKKWLGRDVFEVAFKAFDIDESKPLPSYVVHLKIQYRMHPQISAIANALFYGGNLKDGAWSIDEKNCALSDPLCDKLRLDGWFNYAWGHDAPVLLIDTESTNAWVTSVTRGGKSSRLNFLSAVLCLYLAEKMLSKDRAKLSPGEPPRILVISPYRPHARLTELLISEEGIVDDARAGTVHNFQGSEADAVILDLVNDEPHWRVGMMMPDFDDRTKRLLNVAVTRARRRLVVIGDFKYIEKCAYRAFLGTEFIPFIKKRYPKIDALDLVPSGLAAGSAKAQKRYFGGDVEPDENRIVVTQEDFYPILRGDISRSKQRVVIYSPFLTQDRFSYLEPQIKAAVERGVSMYVVTKTHADRGKRELPQCKAIEGFLEHRGVVVIHKAKMHEKIVFVDETILWTGSLNTLSHSDTREIMERRVSKKVFDDYAKTLRLFDLLSAFDEGNTSCPICGNEMIAAEGTDEPFYWRCVEKGCYTRNIGQPPIKDGVITCYNCGGEVEFGEWGDEPSWRCIENRRHRQPVAKTHLRLPKMAARIPRAELKKLRKKFGLEGDANHDNQAGQQALWDL
jgi:hypothetical protein